MKKKLSNRNREAMRASEQLAMRKLTRLSLILTFAVVMIACAALPNYGKVAIKMPALAVTIERPPSTGFAIRDSSNVNLADLAISGFDVAVDAERNKDLTISKVQASR
jgi:hypothetical protein